MLFFKVCYFILLLIGLIVTIRNFILSLINKIEFSLFYMILNFLYVIIPIIYIILNQGVKYERI